MDWQDANQAQVRQRALALLARREHAPSELAQKLHRRGYAGEDVAAVLAALIAEGLLSEARYAEAVVSARVARGAGPLRIRADLARMRIDEAVVEQTLAAAAVDWLALAQATRRKRFGAQPPQDYNERSRQMRFLQRRGFDFDCIRAAVGEHD